jgi:glycosyltransferase involved in cell wall biosynthesis
MGKIVAFIIPIALHHLTISEQAIASAEAQTVPCEVIPYIDREHRGAGYARNRAIEQTTAPFIIPLDSDDVVEPSFVERTLSVYRPGFYVLTDWIANGQLMRAPDCSPTSVWQTGAVHMVTCLIPRAFHIAAGGFDETLSGFEDTEYFVRMHTLGMCGLRCPEPLLHYRSRLGKRSRDFSDSGQYATINADLVRRYSKHMGVGCGCGGTGNAAPQSAANIPETGDLLCECLYAPANKVGIVTGKRYIRAGFGERIWVNPKDVAKSPQWWSVVSAPYDISPAVDEIMEMVNG